MATNYHGKRTEKDFEQGAFPRRLSGDSSWLSRTSRKIGNRGGGRRGGGIVLNSGYTLVDIQVTVPLQTVVCKGCGIPMYPKVGCKGCKDRERLSQKGLVREVTPKTILTKEEAELRDLMRKSRKAQFEEHLPNCGYPKNACNFCELEQFRKHRQVELQAKIIERGIGVEVKTSKNLAPRIHRAA